MEPANPHIGYVVKRYPRFSETFIVNEILAHEAAGWPLSIFALLPPTDAYFQDAIARVRAPVRYLIAERGMRASDFWPSLLAAGQNLPGFWPTVAAASITDARIIYQAAMLAVAVQQQGIEHLHAHFATSATCVARLAASMAGVSFSFTAHAKDIFHQDVSAADLDDKLADAAAVVTVSDFNLAYLRQQHGANASMVQRIYNGLELDRFAYQPPVARPPHIVAVGRLVEKKGFADLVDACALLAGRGVPFTCDIVGAGPLEADLRNQIERLGLEQRVSLLGPRPQSEIISLVQGGALFVAPCVEASDGDRDGLPTVLLEAMALGTPCVATDVTGIPEVLHHGETGLLVPQRNPAALASAMRQLLEAPALGKRLAAAARQRIECEFDIHRNSAQLRDCFRSCIAQSQPVVTIRSAAPPMLAEKGVG
ncbi:MAG: glycosyltransferase family 4 protein [Chloroflexaceae bacterium]|jgi:glycosyltransferase involved in cell wall biosynthesis|nr:glycosyltransferase family 4 protein [Chloroflexaceae bacterium]